MKIFFTLLIYLLPVISWACSAPLKGGYFGSQDELISKTNNIVLVKYNRKKFVLTEVLKSNNVSNIGAELTRFFRIIARLNKRNKGNHLSNDFEGHNSSEFWSRKSARVGWSAGACTPSFTFIENESYLLFLDSPANLYSAEIIKSKNDKWYQYVLGKVKN